MSAPAIGVRAGFAPGPNAVIDWSHPLAQGLVFYFLPVARRDIVRGLAPTLNGTFVPTPYGVGLRESAVSNLATWSDQVTGHVNFSGTQPFTAMSIVAASTLSSYHTAIGRSTYANESTNTGWQLQIRSTADGRPGLSLVCLNNNGGAVHAADFSGAGDLVADRYQVLVGSNGSARYNYIDGLQTGTSTTATVASATAQLIISRGGGTLTCVASAIWNRELSPGEVAAVQADPFQMLRN